MLLIEQVARYLRAAIPGLSVTYGFMPQAPSRIATVLASDTREPGDEDGARVQVLIRGPDQDGATPAQDADAVVAALRDYVGLLTSQGDYIIRIDLVNGPANIGADQNNRQQYSVNFRVWYC